MSELLPSEQAALAEVQRRLGALGRAQTLVLAGPVDARLGVLLAEIADATDGDYLDLSTPAGYELLTNAAPFHGRDIEGRLSDTVLRQFLLREVRQRDKPVLAVRIPPVIWKVMTETDSEGPKRLMGGLREWACPSTVVMGYALLTDPTSLTIDDLSGLLAHHLVELRLTPSESRYLELEREETVHERK